MKGFINIIKPEGVSSAQAVGAVKKKLHCTCGHMGTLDPMASGVLPIGLEKTSRLFPYLLTKEKTYLAKFKFGILTDTLDITGSVISENPVELKKKAVSDILGRFIGDIKQVPPKYSAKCINGKRGYQLARRGVDFELEPRTVKIYSIDLVDGEKDEFTFRIVCGGGTYIRSLARDMGEALNTTAIMTSLCRESAGAFNLDNGVSLEEFKNCDNPEKYIIPADYPLNFEKLVLTNEQATKILNGVFINYGFEDKIYRVYNESEFWGIGEANDGVLRIKSYVR